MSEHRELAEACLGARLHRARLPALNWSEGRPGRTRRLGRFRVFAQYVRPRMVKLAWMLAKRR